MMQLGSVILKVESQCVADEMWYFPLLKPYYDHVPVKANLSDLKDRIANLNIINFDISSIADLDSIPNEFYCAISQDVMTDPVKTVDNHTYDRPSIEKWFTYRKTSPLTGLELSSLNLVPNKELYSQIQEFIKLQIEKNK